MSTHSVPFLNIKKENHPKLSQICNYGISSKGPKNEFETAVVNKPSVFEPLKFYCTCTCFTVRVKVNKHTSRGSNSTFFPFSPLNIGVNKRICTVRSKFFPSRTDPILQGLYCPGRQTGSHKSCFPW